MHRLALTIRTQILLIVFIVAIPAAGIIVYSGIQMRENAISEAKGETKKLADSIAAGNENLIAGAHQLMLALTQLPDVRHKSAAKVEPLLTKILLLNSQYSNILIADRAGWVWAAAVPTHPTFNVSDRRYFKNALSNGQLSSGEYVISRATTKPTFNLAYPLKDEQGKAFGVIIVGFVLDFYEHLLDRSGLPSGTSFVLLDHKGIVLYRAVSSAESAGKQFDAGLFKVMQEGTDVDTIVGAITISGDKRILTYRKLRLPGEQSPYLYIWAGSPLSTVLAGANSVLIRNVAFFTSFLALAVLFAWFLGKRSIADRITLLENASRKLAAGDLHVRVADIIVGGELGRLGETFDAMASQLEVRQQALRDSEERFRSIFNNAMDGILLTDATTGQFITGNNMICSMLGYTEDELRAVTVADIHPLDAMPRVKKHIEETQRGEISVAQELPVRRKDGSAFYADISASLLKLDGKAHVIAVFRDVTERKRDAEEKQKLQAELLQIQKMESIGQLAGGVAHDFNNILAAIIGYGNLVQLKLGVGDPNRKHVSQILASAERAASLTQSLLAFSRKQVINPQNMDLNVSIRKVEKLLLRIIGEDIELTTSLTPEALTIFADTVQVEQILMNLATNARDAMPKGGKLTIETGQVEFNGVQAVTHSFGSPGTYAVLTVSDTGEGMDARTQDKIFDPFFTTKEVGKGTGLGLSIVYGIVKQNDGHINVYSEPGKGTIFKIYMPLVGAAAQDQNAPFSTVPESLQGGAETILLAEDSEAVRQLTHKVLTEYGYTVIEATNGEEALKKFAENKHAIHLMMIDVIMPRKNGREILEEARKLKPDIKVLFTSGYPADLLKREGIFEHGLNFLPKPATPQDILKKVRFVLDQ